MYLTFEKRKEDSQEKKVYHNLFHRSQTTWKNPLWEQGSEWSECEHSPFLPESYFGDPKFLLAQGDIWSLVLSSFITFRIVLQRYIVLAVFL